MEVHVHLAVVMPVEPVELVAKAAAVLLVELAVPHKQEILILGLWAWQEQEETEDLAQVVEPAETNALPIMPE